jgi:hypothetical protein
VKVLDDVVPLGQLKPVEQTQFLKGNCLLINYHGGDDKSFERIDILFNGVKTVVAKGYSSAITVLPPKVTSPTFTFT